MNKKIFGCFLMMTLLLLLSAPGLLAASQISITGAKTDIMPAFDRTMPSANGGLSGIVPRENTAYHPAYPRPNDAIHLEITSSGITYPFYIMQGDGSPIRHTIASTSYTSQGRVDNVKILIKDITYSSDSTSHWHLANKITIRSWNGPAVVESLAVRPQWYYK